MKPLFIVSLIAFSVLALFGQAQADTASVQQTLMQMERDWGQAAAKNDTAAVDKLMADDWVGYCAAINLAGARQTRWQRITRHLDHGADDCRWQALRRELIVAGRQ
jgi:ketosteroid isomerase-like protein